MGACAPSIRIESGVAGWADTALLVMSRSRSDRRATLSKVARVSPVDLLETSLDSLLPDGRMPAGTFELEMGSSHFRPNLHSTPGPPARRPLREDAGRARRSGPIRQCMVPGPNVGSAKDDDERVRRRTWPEVPHRSGARALPRCRARVPVAHDDRDPHYRHRHGRRSAPRQSRRSRKSTSPKGSTLRTAPLNRRGPVRSLPLPGFR